MPVSRRLDCGAKWMAELDRIATIGDVGRTVDQGIEHTLAPTYWGLSACSGQLPSGLIWIAVGIGKKFPK
jgi:hypothetical protein